MMPMKSPHSVFARFSLFPITDSIKLLIFGGRYSMMEMERFYAFKSISIVFEYHFM